LGVKEKITKEDIERIRVIADDNDDKEKMNRAKAALKELGVEEKSR